jgi:hypothetical protein
MAIGFPIIFSEIDKAKSQKEKKELLLKYKSAPLMEILKYTFQEAQLLIQIKDKKIKCRGLTYKLVKETFPELIP